jgi:hypothetical protein
MAVYVQPMEMDIRLAATSTIHISVPVDCN